MRTVPSTCTRGRPHRHGSPTRERGDIGTTGFRFAGFAVRATALALDVPSLVAVAGGVPCDHREELKR